MLPSEQARAWAALTPAELPAAIRLAIVAAGPATLLPLARALGALLARLPTTEGQELRAALLAPVTDPSGLDPAFAALRAERDELAQQLARWRADGQCQANERRLSQLDADCRQLTGRMALLQEELHTLDEEIHRWDGQAPDPARTDEPLPLISAAAVGHELPIGGRQSAGRS